jgi:polyferredoxin
MLKKIMFKRCKRVLVIALAALTGLFLFTADLHACNGKDVILSENLDIEEQDSRGHQLDEEGNLLYDESLINITPEHAREIAELFLTENIQPPPFPLTFRKLENVHRKIVYQFESQPLEGYDGEYHLGPVNFKVEKLVLDVDAKTGNIHIANGCGAAPGKMVYKYDPSDFDGTLPESTALFASNNTNFIARNTGNTIKIDGKISPEEWKDTGHKYFYLGTYKSHNPSEEHKEPYYYVEVWTQIDNNNIYFAVKTDTPYWVGLMFKKDANLGMLGAYRDAKVMKSNGEVSDRHFTQRPNKTFYLKNDDTDHISAKGNQQNHFYTYEFAYPLKTFDKQDISFEIGKAYNMLLVVGNTMKHYGIFTLDKAHANHDHSKSNAEHADVWASNETTFRIGEAADRDIYGNPVTAAFTSFDSGFDPSKKENHFHYAGISLKDFAGRSSMTGYVSLLSVVLGMFGVGIILNRSRPSSSNRPDHKEKEGFDLLKITWLKRMITSKYFRYAFIVPTMLIFLAITYLGFVDVQDGQRNIATVFTWTLWWSLVIFTFIIAGRLWCMMCPFAVIADFFQKFVSLNKKLPYWLQNMGLQTIGFLVLTWAFTILAFGSSPFVTSVVIIIILAAAIIFSVIYERRSFCRHLCPIGAVIGIYSMVSPFELRSSNKNRCDVHKRKTCTEACPMLESPEDMDNNVYCNFCMKCQPACPSQNLSLRLRTFGKDIYASLRKSKAEAIAALLLLGVVIVETLAMTSSWEPLKNSFSSLSGITAPSVVYTLVFSLVLLIPVGIFYLICYLLKLWLGKRDYRTQDLMKDFAFLFIPMGVGLHFAHNIQHLLLESPIALPATIRFLQNVGIGASLSPNWNPSPLLGLETIFFIQMGILVTGFVFTLYVLFRLLRRYQKPLYHMYKMTIAMSLYALVIVLSSIYMLGLPMSGRHVH